MIEYAQIRAMLHQLIAFQISLDEMDEWLSRESWNMHQDSGADAIRLVGAIEGRVAEFEQGHISERDLYRALERLVDVVNVQSREPEVRIIASGSVDAGQPFSFKFGPWAGADTQFGLEFSSALPQRA